LPAKRRGPNALPEVPLFNNQRGAVAGLALRGVPAGTGHLPGGYARLSEVGVGG
jgi:hypothetical protein